MAHLVETMAYANATPWHGLGNQVSDALTPEEMLVAAGLDWTVSRRQIFTTQEKDPTSDNSLKANDWGLLVRDSDNQIFGPCGKNYIPLQNHEVFTFFDKFVKAGHMKMETAGSLAGGRQVWGLAAINQGFVLPGGDEVNGYLLLSQPHVWGKSLNIMFTPIRVVCNNTLTLSLNTRVEKMVKFDHRRQFDGEIVKEALGVAKEKLAKYKEMASFLGSKKATGEDVVTYFKRIFPLKIGRAHV